MTEQKKQLALLKIEAKEAQLKKEYNMSKKKTNIYISLLALLGLFIGIFFIVSGFREHNIIQVCAYTPVTIFLGFVSYIEMPDL